MAEASARGHFESSYETEFDPPRDIDFIFYCSDTWKAVRRLARGARVVIDLGSGGGTLLYNVARCATGVVAGIDFSMSAIRGAARLVPAPRLPRRGPPTPPLNHTPASLFFI